MTSFGRWLALLSVGMMSILIAVAFSSQQLPRQHALSVLPTSPLPTSPPSPLAHLPNPSPTPFPRAQERPPGEPPPPSMGMMPSSPLSTVVAHPIPYATPPSSPNKCGFTFEPIWPPDGATVQSQSALRIHYLIRYASGSDLRPGRIKVHLTESEAKPGDNAPTSQDFTLPPECHLSAQCSATSFDNLAPHTTYSWWIQVTCYPQEKTEAGLLIFPSSARIPPIGPDSDHSPIFTFTIQ